MGFKQGAKHSDVHNYQHPQGPTNMHHEAPGLGGHNCGPCGTQHDGGGEDCGSDESGHVEIHGSDHGMGTNRKG